MIDRKRERETRFLMTARPSRSAACSWKTFLARSTPTMVIFYMDASSLVATSTSPPWHIDAAGRGCPLHQN